MAHIGRDEIDKELLGAEDLAKSQNSINVHVPQQ